MLATTSPELATFPDENARSISPSAASRFVAFAVRGVELRAPIRSWTPRLGVPAKFVPRLPGCIKNSSSSIPDPSARAPAPKTASASSTPVLTLSFKLLGRRRPNDELRASFPSGVGALLSSSPSSSSSCASTSMSTRLQGSSACCRPLLSSPHAITSSISNDPSPASSPLFSSSESIRPVPCPRSRASIRRSALAGPAEDGVLLVWLEQEWLELGGDESVDVRRFLEADEMVVSSSASASFFSATGSGSPDSTKRRSVEFQRFLIALSVLPGRSFAISAQRFSNRPCASISSASSSADHLSFLTFGSSWLCHRSRICLPLRPGRWTASADHDLVPKRSTSWIT
mmetsp:Transcript_59439/g.140053  ORF Transcript_59439/g.140053 Transcript_59439/m.140053 type:complete len:344 (+) Transcript_59439:547-1578(+)